MKNRHGLNRNIPESIKTKVREKCGFGCVICGAIPYHYDHFRIDFKNARSHDADDIVLLCHKHHHEKTHGIIDPSVIEEFILKNTSDKKVSYNPSILTDEFEIKWPTIDLRSQNNNILVDGEEVFKITKTGDSSDPVSLDGRFSDRLSNDVCVVKKNEFISFSEDLGDITCISNRLTYKSKNGTCVLRYSIGPKLLQIHEMNFVKNRCFIMADENRFIIGNGSQCIQFVRGTFVATHTAIELKSSLTPLLYLDDEIILPPMSIFPDAHLEGSVGLFLA